MVIIGVVITDVIIADMIWSSLARSPPAQVLDVGWRREDDEEAVRAAAPGMDPVSAGRRGISERLLRRLLEGLPLSYRLVRRRRRRRRSRRR